MCHSITTRGIGHNKPDGVSEIRPIPLRRSCQLLFHTFTHQSTFESAIAPMTNIIGQDITPIAPECMIYRFIYFAKNQRNRGLCCWARRPRGVPREKAGSTENSKKATARNFSVSDMGSFHLSIYDFFDFLSKKLAKKHGKPKSLLSSRSCSSL